MLEHPNIINDNEPKQSVQSLPKTAEEHDLWATEITPEMLIGRPYIWKDWID